MGVVIEICTKHPRGRTASTTHHTSTAAISRFLTFIMCCLQSTCGNHSMLRKGTTCKEVRPFQIPRVHFMYVLTRRWHVFHYPSFLKNWSTRFPMTRMDESWMDTALKATLPSLTVERYRTLLRSILCIWICVCMQNLTVYHFCVFIFDTYG